MEKKQTAALENQDIILVQDQKIAKSLESTHSQMSEAFQEMFEKAETQKVLLDQVFGSLNKGFAGVQWLLSSILGEILSLETALFFTATFLFVTFLPQFGFSRLWLYLVLVGYGMLEGVVRRCVFWLTHTPSQDTMVS